MRGSRRDYTEKAILNTMQWQMGYIPTSHGENGKSTSIYNDLGNIMKRINALLPVYILAVSSSALHAESSFVAKDCEYSVKFPSTPEYRTGFDPKIGEYTQAQFRGGNKKNGFFLRAECIGTGDIRNSEINTKSFLQKQIVAYAESNGLSNSEYHYGEGKHGKYVQVRGFKSISDVPVTYEAYIYVGNSSFISLYAGGASSSYPQAPVFKFFRSVQRK